MNIIELAKAYELHQEWLKDPKSGERADFSGLYFKNHNFYGMNLQGANFDSCDLERSIFTGANLTNCTFKRANLSYAQLYRTNLTRANFEFCDMDGILIDGCILPYPVPQSSIVIWALSSCRDEIIKAIIPENAHRIRLLHDPRIGRTHMIIPVEIIKVKTKAKINRCTFQTAYIWDGRKPIPVEIGKQYDWYEYNGHCSKAGGRGFEFYFEEKDIPIRRDNERNSGKRARGGQ